MAQPRTSSTPVDALGSTIASQSSRLTALETVAHRHESMSDILIPTGMMAPYAGQTAPDSWLLCFGQAISRTTYADLFAVIGTIYGAGDGSTTFNLPDLRGRVIAGVDSMGGTPASRLTATTITGGGDQLGETGGDQVHTLTTAQMPAHSHAQVGRWTTSTSHSHAGIGGGAAESSNPSNAGATGMGNTGDAGSTQAHNNVQPTIVLNYIIKA